MATDGEKQVIKSFLEGHFGVGYAPGSVSADEKKSIANILSFVAQKFKRSRYPLGLALDMALLAQQLSLHDSDAKPFRKDMTKEDLFRRYTLVTARGDTDANTLTLTFGNQEVGIRRLEEGVGNLFVALKRPGYASAYVYNTGQWRKYQDALQIPAYATPGGGVPTKSFNTGKRREMSDTQRARRLETEALVIGYAMSRLDAEYIRCRNARSWGAVYEEASRALGVRALRNRHAVTSRLSG